MNDHAKRFNNGDRVTIACSSYDGAFFGKSGTVKFHSMGIFGIDFDEEIRFLNRAARYWTQFSESTIELEHVYDSPLYEALR